MQPALLTGVVLAVFIVTTLYLTRRLLNGQTAATPEEIYGQAPIDFGPMARLLDDSDFEFLRSQPGYDKSLERDLRRRRAHVCRAYLTSLEREFERLHKMLRMLSLTATVDRPDLTGLLVREKFQFTGRLAMAHFNVTAYSLGFQPGGVGRLVQCIESMRTLAQSTELAALPSRA